MSTEIGNGPFVPESVPRAEGSALPVCRARQDAALLVRLRFELVTGNELPTQAKTRRPPDGDLNINIVENTTFAGNPTFLGT